jgi:predicted RND superfamily exporter protein
MNRPLLERQSPLGVTYALLVLIAFFFLVPSAFRAARLSLGQKENDVKDWLPSDFPETAELEWFADHFVGESFVLATWPGCTSGDQRLKLLEQKLIRESDAYDPTPTMSPELIEHYQLAKATGRELGLLRADRSFDNWGGQQEKWLASPDEKWYYITPDGRLYRWEESVNIPAALIRSAKQSLGKYELRGQLVTAFGDPKAEGTNPFYNNPALFCTPLFHSVQTGDSIANELSQEGAALWPIDLTDEDQRKKVAMRNAMGRLTGTLFAPAVPPGFDWTAESFRQVIPAGRRDRVPAEFDIVVNNTVAAITADQYDGSIQQLSEATAQQQADAWYAVFDAVNVEPPPRLTCVLVTLTDVAKENLAFAIGRGVLGAQRGRLLELAEEAGVQPAAPPSVAPPPFNKPDIESVGGVPPLRMGGPPVDNIAIDEEGTITLVRLVGYSVVVGVVLSYLCFRSVMITLMVFVVGGTAAVLSMSFVWWSGGSVDAILMSMPSLVYVLGLSGSIHVINYYRDEVRLRGQAGAANRALRHAFFPCTLASITTAIGLISLYSSNLAPIKNFGLFAAIGVVATLAILFSFLPAALQTFAPGAKRVKPEEEDQPAPQQVEPRLEESWLSNAWAAVGSWITQHHAAVTVTCLIMLVGASLGLTKIETSVQLLKLFDGESRIIRDYAWLEANYGKLVPTELILRVPESMQAPAQRVAEGEGPDEDAEPIAQPQSLDMLERVEAVSRIGTVVRRTLGETGLKIVGQAMAADTFLPTLPAPSNGYWPVRTAFNKKLLEGRDGLLSSDYLRMESEGPFKGSELWRISLRVGALSDVDYGEFISTLRTAVEPVMRAYDTREELLRQLTTGESGKPAKLSGKDLVVVIGSGRPKSLTDVSMLKEDLPADDETISDADRIDTDAIYLSALGVLLSGEPIRKPLWIDPNAEESPLEVGSDKWNRLIGGLADAVIWVGGDGIKASDFSGAKRLVDARKIQHKSVQPELVGDRIPNVAGSGELQVIYTGVVPVVYKAQRTLLVSLVNSIGLAFVLIAAVMIVLLNPGRFPLGWLRPVNFGNGLLAGAVSMIPNLFPVLFVFGVMGHLGRLVDIGTMMTASVAMGVAVDDTIHFLSWFRSYLDKGMSRVEAVVETYRRVGPAMTQTTLVGGLGLFVFALSTFTPTQRFGTLMLVLLGAALFGDLILLPALLAGPAGRFFKRREHVCPEEADVVVGNVLEAGEQSKSDRPAVAVVGGEELEPEAESSDKNALPHLRVHFPQRTDAPHGVKRR